MLGPQECEPERERWGRNEPIQLEVTSKNMVADETVVPLFEIQVGVMKLVEVSNVQMAVSTP